MRQRSSRMIARFAVAGGAALLGILHAMPAAAEASKASPVGVWMTIDDETGSPKSHVQIWEREGTVYGKIIKLLNPTEPDPRCTKCKGSRANKRITGMTILWGMTKRDNGWYEGGRILDPANGKIYGCKIRITGGGSKLDVRGFLGISLFGRTQTWRRLR